MTSRADPSASASDETVGRRTTALSLSLPAIVLLMVWSVVPLGMTLWFSFRRYNLMLPERGGFDRFGNYHYLFTDPSLIPAVWNTLVLLGAVLSITIGFGTAIALLLDQEFFGRSIVRLLVLAPFFVMPTVSALVWKNMVLNPDNGVFAFLMRLVHLKPIDWLGEAPLTSIVMIVSWEWLPFAVLTLLTSMQSLDSERKEAARMDGAGPIAMFRYIIWPHLGRAVSAVVMIETIFLLGIFAEVYVTTAGGPGSASTNLSFLVYRYVLMEYDVGAASVAGLVAVLLANVLAFFLLRWFARNVRV